MRLSPTGQPAMGTATVSIDGATPAALVGQVTGGYLGPSWLTATQVLYQSGGTGAGPWTLQRYDTTTTSATLVDPTGMNELAAGQGVWAAWLAGVGVRTNVPGLGPFPAGALGDVATDTGELCLVTTRATATGLTVYDSSGGVRLSLPAVTVTVPIVRVRSHRLAFSQTRGGWTLAATDGTAVAFAPRTGETITWITPVVAGALYVLERSERLTLRDAASPHGWVLVPAGGLAFNPDVMALSAGVVRVAWSTNQGESPDALQMIDLTLATGATVQWTVSGGALVSAPGPTLTRETFTVGPLQTSGATGNLAPPLQHPVVDTATGDRVTRPWAMFFQQQATGLGDASRAIAASPAPVPQGPSFGIVAGPMVPLVATHPADTLTLTSTDASVTFTSDPTTNTLDLSATGGGGLGTHYDCPLSDGDLVAADLIFADGECIIVQVPG